MQYKGRFHLRWRTMVLVCIAVLGLVTVFRIASAARSDFGPTPQQDVIRLENRMTQLEQRVFAIDNSLRNLEQQSRLGAGASRGVSPEDFARLRFEMQTLQQRLAEHECALAKLDERTLSPAIRAERRKSGTAAGDPCRQNVDTPLQNAPR